MNVLVGLRNRRHHHRHLLLAMKSWRRLKRKRAENSLLFRRKAGQSKNGPNMPARTDVITACNQHDK